ncbi:hypothetical protein ACS0TY_000852 [Phlomoides rotata]
MASKRILKELKDLQKDPPTLCLDLMCLPVTIDVGTNNEQLLNDEFYIGLNIKRATGQEYVELLDEFMCAVKQNYGEKVLVQFEMGEDYRQPPTIRRIEGE